MPQDPALLGDPGSDSLKGLVPGLAAGEVNSLTAPGPHPKVGMTVDKTGGNHGVRQIIPGDPGGNLSLQFDRLANCPDTAILPPHGVPRNSGDQTHDMVGPEEPTCLGRDDLRHAL
jgi:hypothetical protein